MDKEIKLKIEKFRTEIEKARKILEKNFASKIKTLDVQLALAVHFNVQHSAHLIAKDLNAGQILDILKDFDFSEDSSDVYDNWVNNISPDEVVLPLFMKSPFLN